MPIHIQVVCCVEKTKNTLCFVIVVANFRPDTVIKLPSLLKLGRPQKDGHNNRPYFSRHTTRTDKSLMYGLGCFLTNKKLLIIIYSASQGNAQNSFSAGDFWTMYHFRVLLCNPLLEAKALLRILR